MNLIDKRLRIIKDRSLLSDVYPTKLCVIVIKYVLEKWIFINVNKV